MKRWFSTSETRLNFLTGAFILGLFLLPFLPNLAGFGFYKDDWHMIWAGHTRGPQAIISLFVIDRPFMGVVNSITYALLGDSPLAWTVFALVLRAAGALAFFWLISLAWPKLGRSSAWAVLLFLIYPGFLQQPNAATFQNHFITLGLAVLSIALSLKAVQSGRSPASWLFTVLALLSGGTYLLIYEYMIGLEVTRLAFLGLQVSRQAGTLRVRERVRCLVQLWLPYAGLLAAFLVWRVLIFKSARSVTNIGSLAAKYTGDPLGMGANLLLGFIKDFFEAAVSGWFVPFYQLTSKAPVRVFLPALMIGLIGAGLAWAAARGLLAQRQEDERSGWSKEAVLIGLISIAGGILPVIAADRNILFESQFDRYTLHLTLGIALLLVGLSHLLLAPVPRGALFALLVGASLMTQFANGVYWKQFWEVQRQLWWQLSWRAPDLKQNTLLAVNLPSPYGLAESYEVWAPANLIYHSGSEPLYLAGEPLNRETLPFLLAQRSMLRTVRRVEMVQDYKQALVLSIPADGGCLHLIDGSTQAIIETEDPLVRFAAPYSRPDLVLDASSTGPAAHPAAVIFGAEPAHGWCYTYQKAGLAYQRSDWAEIARLGDAALADGLEPVDPGEWMPFYEAYARSGRFEDANRIGSFLRDEYPALDQYCLKFPAIPDEQVSSVDDYLTANLCSDFWSRRAD